MPLSDEQIAQERVKFEAWAQREALDVCRTTLPQFKGRYDAPRSESAWVAWQARAAIERAVSAPAGVRQGFKLVPIEPTPEMVAAAAAAARRYMQETGGNSPQAMYEAMLAASPSQPEGPAAAPVGWTKCKCGQPWTLNTVHREHTPCWRAPDPRDGLAAPPQGPAAVVEPSALNLTRYNFNGDGSSEIAEDGEFIRFTELETKLASPSLPQAEGRALVQQALEALELVLDEPVGDGIRVRERIGAEISYAADSIVRALRASLAAQPPQPADPKPYALCRRRGGCVCGGDTAQVRAGCQQWKGDQ